MTSTSRLEAYHFYEEEWEDFDELRDAFEWEVPDEFNIATYVCDRWATDERVAVYAEDETGTQSEITYDQIQTKANKLANFLEKRGVERGDRVGVCLPQRFEVIVSFIAAWKLGAIVVPLSTLFGPDALEYRLTDCDVSVCVADATTGETIRDVVDLETFVLADNTAQDGEYNFGDVISEHSPEFETVRTDPEDGACIIYTSGTTGKPKGVLHAHKFVLGMLPLMCRCFMEESTTEGQVWWTPVEWSWIGSLNNMLSGLFYGVTLVAYNGGQFDPERAFELIDRYDMTFLGVPPTALRMMMTVDGAKDRFDVSELSIIGSGGEKLEKSTVEWVDETFDGATIQEAYGQTESGLDVGDFYPPVPVRRGKIGVEMPGYTVRIVDPETREPVETGEIGEIAIRYDDNPACFKKYWNKPEKTERKVQDGWLLTEDLGTVDEDGYFSFETRADDVIISSGYKISPVEIEETLGQHDAVLASGVVGVPHDERGEIPRAYVSLHDDFAPSDELRTELQQYVKDTLAKYEYPRELEFVDELPKTATGKISRHELRVEAGVREE
jgi:acetyl-CoA synthetase